jgi:16S rRNA (adenine1518-N6/adenine1519-N6)-dimethyltransferase
MLVKKKLKHGIALKKQYGQHFLHEQIYVDHMIDAAEITPSTSVFEIGCGDGFLTKSLLQTPLQRLWVFEIDPEWAEFVKKTYPDERMTIFTENILDVDYAPFEEYKPWTLLANLPYQVTFPILYKLIDQRHLLKEGVVMVQEEVAQKIVRTSGRGYGFASLFLQYHFSWRLLDKVPPRAFLPPPKVQSRLIYFIPHKSLIPIPKEKEFWAFIKRCFQQPRRTLRNNLASYHYDLKRLSDETLLLRGQQLGIEELITLWTTLVK